MTQRLPGLPRSDRVHQHENRCLRHAAHRRLNVGPRDTIAVARVGKGLFHLQAQLPQPGTDQRDQGVHGISVEPPAGLPGPLGDP